MTNSTYDDVSKKKENVTALMSEELCKFCKTDAGMVDIKAAKPILKSAIWILEARKLEIKKANNNSPLTLQAIDETIKELETLIASLQAYIDRI